jgi:hypothetical protein
VVIAASWAFVNRVLNYAVSSIAWSSVKAVGNKSV